MLKQCTKCKERKPESEYFWKIKAKGRKSPSCKSCHKEYRKVHYKKYRGKVRAKITARKKQIKEKYKNLKSTLKCARCSESHPATLQFHHPDSNKEAGVSKLIAWGVSWKRVKEEIDKCEVLCANCHSKHHWAEHFSGIGIKAVP